jgi:hypothetical protein
MLRNTADTHSARFNTNIWTFFPTTYGLKADGCQEPNLLDVATQWKEPARKPGELSAIQAPPWPQGTFYLQELFGEKDCTYTSDGRDTGFAWCPSIGEGRIEPCRADDEKDVKEYKFCEKLPDGSWTWFHRVVTCDWESA